MEANRTDLNTLATDCFVIAEELNIPLHVAGRVARIRSCKDIPAVVGMSVAAERHWRRRSSTTLAEVKAAAEAATLAA